MEADPSFLTVATPCVFAALRSAPHKLFDPPGNSKIAAGLIRVGASIRPSHGGTAYHRDGEEAVDVPGVQSGGQGGQMGSAAKLRLHLHI